MLPKRRLIRAVIYSEVDSARRCFLANETKKERLLKSRLKSILLRYLVLRCDSQEIVRKLKIWHRRQLFVPMKRLIALTESTLRRGCLELLQTFTSISTVLANVVLECRLLTMKWLWSQCLRSVRSQTDSSLMASLELKLKKHLNACRMNLELQCC